MMAGGGALQRQSLEVSVARFLDTGMMVFQYHSLLFPLRCFSCQVSWYWNDGKSIILRISHHYVSVARFLDTGMMAYYLTIARGAFLSFSCQVSWYWNDGQIFSGTLFRTMCFSCQVSWYWNDGGEIGHPQASLRFQLPGFLILEWWSLWHKWASFLACFSCQVSWYWNDGRGDLIYGSCFHVSVARFLDTGMMGIRR